MTNATASSHRSKTYHQLADFYELLFARFFRDRIHSAIRSLDLPPGEHELVVRAWDSSAATQPEDEASLWNPKGYVNNARPRITLNVPRPT